MKKYNFCPGEPGGKMTIVCFVSGSGTNYLRIVEKNPRHNYIVFTNRPGCEGSLTARSSGHPVIELDHLPFLEPAREKHGTKKIPRNCPEREQFEQNATRLIENEAGREPDLVCLAGYDQWITDWMVDRYYPRILNVHPGDTTRGYDGLHWVPSAKALLAGDEALRSTLFLVDKGEDTGPVLVQSRPLNIKKALDELESEGMEGLLNDFDELTRFTARNAIFSYEAFKSKAFEHHKRLIKRICQSLQSQLKKKGDWEIYPFGVHELISRGRVEVEGRNIFVDGKTLPPTGYRMDSLKS